MKTTANQKNFTYSVKFRMSSRLLFCFEKEKPPNRSWETGLASFLPFSIAFIILQLKVTVNINQDVLTCWSFILLKVVWDIYHPICQMPVICLSQSHLNFIRQGIKAIRISDLIFLINFKENI